MRRKIACQFRGNGRSEGLVGGLGMVARVAQNAYLVLHLHHQHGVIAAVDFLEVPHERGKGACRRPLGGRVGQRAQDFDFRAVLNHAGKAARILLDPDGRVARHAVLPGGEPEKNDALVLAAAPGQAGRRRARSRSLPSSGSISSQLSGVTTVLRPMAASCGQSGFMYSRLDEEELCSSPDSMRKGLPSTMSWVVRAALFEVRRPET